MADNPGMPVTCTLQPSSVEDRLAAWRALAADSIRRRSVPDGTVLTVPAPLAATVEDLVESERACCGFLSFELRAAAGAIELHITSSSAGGREVIELLVGVDAGG